MYFKYEKIVITDLIALYNATSTSRIAPFALYEEQGLQSFFLRDAFCDKMVREAKKGATSLPHTRRIQYMF